MPVGELARRTGVSTATINYYVNLGVLPRPEKTGRTRALYPGSFVDRIVRIKELQGRGLPLRVIATVVNSEDPGADLGIAPAPVPGAQRRSDTPAHLSVVRFLEATGLPADAYSLLIEKGLLSAPRRIAGADTMHDRRDLGAGRSYARLLAAGVGMDVIARHGEYEPLSRAEAHLLAEHLATAMRAQAAGNRAAGVVSAFDSVRRYLRHRELESAYPGWISQPE